MGLLFTDLVSLCSLTFLFLFPHIVSLCRAPTGDLWLSQQGDLGIVRCLIWWFRAPRECVSIDMGRRHDPASEVPVCHLYHRSGKSLRTSSCALDSSKHSGLKETFFCFQGRQHKFHPVTHLESQNAGLPGVSERTSSKILWKSICSVTTILP
ncbi:uncharacterized protein LOC143681453 isoform X1 [Tamandua tetradactyla]|uniref:uncharacterized protein LOC143681453 isoform X1 n=1 Tax=Tamandua tetradactyla TaxID=48850 RepID=UPI0040549F80